MDDLWAIVNIQHMAPGFAGGIMHAFLVRKASAWQIIGYIVVGGLAANFFVPYVLVILKLLPPLLALMPAGAVAFLVGMGGFNLCRKADKWAGSWNPFERTKNE